MVMKKRVWVRFTGMLMRSRVIDVRRTSQAHTLGNYNGRLFSTWQKMSPVVFLHLLPGTFFCGSCLLIYFYEFEEFLLRSAFRFHSLLYCLASQRLFTYFQMGLERCPSTAGRRRCGAGRRRSRDVVISGALRRAISAGRVQGAGRVNRGIVMFYPLLNASGSPAKKSRWLSRSCPCSCALQSQEMGDTSRRGCWPPQYLFTSRIFTCCWCCQ